MSLRPPRRLVTLRGMDIWPILRESLTFLPGVQRFLTPGAGGTHSARYCYSVWLRHLDHAAAAGLDVPPRVVAELGPGNSLGVGLAALLSGSDEYYAFDAASYAAVGENLRVLEELIDLYRAREPIPGADEFPAAKPEPRRPGFPRDVLTDELLDRALRPERLDAIRRAIRKETGPGGIVVRYVAPWDGPAVPSYDEAASGPEPRSPAGPKRAGVDFLLSQAVLEHVADVEATYAALAWWIKPGAMMSHQIDLRSHGFGNRWNGHWQYPDPVWRVVKGNRLWSINRAPYSEHLEQMRRRGFRVVKEIPMTTPSTIARKTLAPRYRGLSDQDLTTSGAFVLAVRT
jgi:hypothetical protein